MGSPWGDIKINGVTYKFVGWAGAKKSAQKIANKFRRRGKNVRVRKGRKDTGGYDVFVKG